MFRWKADHYQAHPAKEGKMGAATGHEGDHPERAGSKQEQRPKYCEMSDGDLMALVQVNGDSEAWDELCRKYIIIIKKRLSPWKQVLDIDDVTQEVLIKIFVKCKSFDPSLPLLPYILTITRNTAISLLRKHNPEVQPEEGVLESLSFDPDVLEFIEAKEFAENFRKAWDKLPQWGREVLRARYYEGLSEEEIGRRYGVTSRTIRTWQRKAERLMAKYLLEIYGGSLPANYLKMARFLEVVSESPPQENSSEDVGTDATPDEQ